MASTLHAIFCCINPSHLLPADPASAILAANHLPALFQLPSQRTARIIIQRNILHSDLLMRFMWATYFSHNDVSLLPLIYMLHVLLAHYIQTARWCPVIYFTATGALFAALHFLPCMNMINHLTEWFFMQMQLPVQTLAFMCYLANCRSILFNKLRRGSRPTFQHCQDLLCLHMLIYLFCTDPVFHSCPAT